MMVEQTWPLYLKSSQSNKFKGSPKNVKMVIPQKVDDEFSFCKWVTLVSLIHFAVAKL